MENHFHDASNLEVFPSREYVTVNSERTVPVHLIIIASDRVGNRRVIWRRRDCDCDDILKSQIDVTLELYM